MEESGIPHRRAVIGDESNFWLFSSETGFDLTHPTTPDEQVPDPRVTLRTDNSPVTIAPSKSALIIVDMQNFFLSSGLGRTTAAGHAACDQLVQYAIPACRKAGIQIVWLNWGLTPQEVQEMPPAAKRAFGFQTSHFDEGHADAKSKWLPGVDDVFAETEQSVAVDRMGDPRHKGGHELLDNDKSGKIYKGLGSPCGTVKLDDGRQIDAGRLLMRDTWNAALYPPLDKMYEEGLKAAVPDVWVHKNRMVSSILLTYFH
jgi:nicotinamidase-related amidase